jgi:hypothetical protein
VITNLLACRRVCVPAAEGEAAGEGGEGEIYDEDEDDEDDV